ncbi:MAG TPA: zinc ribbon domain-containing protein [Solirubrobacterales bacterium]|nr:zinc ribbon domain-containing protein [Solirubrobacterales bacterium]
MALAIFGITNDALNLVATLFLLMLVVLWLALIVYTYLDARRRISDPFLVACATVASFFPFIGTAVYAIVRPPEFLEDAHERELEIKAAELRVRQLQDQTCPNCEYPVERNYLRCPNCQRRLKDPCPTCNKPVDPRWGLCPFCETALGGGERSRRPRRRPEGERPERSEGGEKRRRSAEAPPRGEPGEQSAKRPVRRKKAKPAAAKPAAERPSATETESQKPTEEQRSPTREPDPDPRQA